MGLYNHIDYSKHPEDYCGIKITDTPLMLESSKKSKKINQKRNQVKNRINFKLQIIL